MRKRRDWLLLLLALGLVVGGLLLLPQLRTATVGIVPNEGSVDVLLECSRSDTELAPLGDSARYVPIVRVAADVGAGDTLGLLYYDGGRDLRAALLAMVEGGDFDTARLSMTPRLRERLVAIFGATPPRASLAVETASQPTRPEPAPTRQVLRGFDREMVEMDLMGAVDGLEDYEARLARAEEAGSDEEVAELGREIERRSVVVTGIRRRLAAREPDPNALPQSQSEPTGEVAAAPLPQTGEGVPKQLENPESLTDRQRAALLQLAEEVPLESLCVLAAAQAGTFEPSIAESQRLPRGERVGTFLVAGEGSGDDAAVGTPAYYLVARGLPLLWARAERVERLAPGQGSSASQVRVVYVER